MGHSSHSDEARKTIQAFKEAVNMTASELEKWLDTEESKSVGLTREGEHPDDKHDSIGHQSGERIVRLLQATSEPSTDGLAHMEKVTSYVHRHLAQRPAKEEIETSRWRYSLMNWGHDPLKD